MSTATKQQEPTMATVETPVTYYERTGALCASFTKELFKAVPEMDALFILPIWTIPNDRLPPAILYYRGGEPTAATALRSGVQLSLAAKAHMHHIGQIFNEYDEAAGRLAEKIKGHQSHLANLEEMIRAKTAELESLGSGRSGETPHAPE